MTNNESLGETIRRVLRDAPFAMRQLAADAGLSYDVLRSWRSGRRRPSKASAQRLADGLEQRGRQLLELARELRETAGSGSGGAPPAAREEDRSAGSAPGGAAAAPAREDDRSRASGPGSPEDQGGESRSESFGGPPDPFRREPGGGAAADH